MPSSGRDRAFNITPIRNPQSFLPQALEQQDTIPDTPLPDQTAFIIHSPTQRSRSSAASTPSHAVRHPYHDPTTTQTSPERDAIARLRKAYWSPKRSAVAPQPTQSPDSTQASVTVHADHPQHPHLQASFYDDFTGMQTPTATTSSYKPPSQGDVTSPREELSKHEVYRKVILESQRATAAHLRALNSQLQFLTAAPDCPPQQRELLEVELELERVEDLHNGHAHMWDQVTADTEKLWAQMSVPDGDVWGYDEFEGLALARGQ